MKTENTTKTFLDIKEVLKNGNSSINQNIKRQFVQKHVYLNINGMAEYILSKSFEDNNVPFSFDDITNYYSYPELIGTFVNFEGGTEEERQTEIDRLKDVTDSKQSQIEDIDTEDTESANFDEDIKIKGLLILEAEILLTEIEELESLESEQQDIFEWWAVSSFLAEKLSEQGYCVIDGENIWGRTTTGQAILVDYVITKICADMEILQGQANSWEY